jgi:RimJ/RimL family protein N-acetyltransferase
VVLDRHDAHASTARLSIYVGEKIARGKGIGRSAVYLAAREGLVSRGLHKIWLIVHAQNAAAIKTYTSLGFVQEGVLRDEFILDGRRLPALYMGLLKAEFEQLDAVRVQA